MCCGRDGKASQRRNAPAAASVSPQAILRAKQANITPQDRYRQAIQQFTISNTKKPIINNK